MAAGLGFKTFTTGEVLTAADTNGYLMQGILVFATEAARNSAITSPQEGQFAFTKDTNTTWFYDGAAWVLSGATGDVTGVTAGTGITVTSPTGPVPTVAIDATVTTLTGTQTLTNKTLTSPALTTPTISTATTNGDILYGTGSGALQRLGIGSASQVLTVASGIPSWATPAGGGGKVLQVVSATYGTKVDSATNTYVDSGLTATITPTLATSTILVCWGIDWRKDSAQSANAINLKLLRGATGIVVSSSLGYTGSAIYNIGTWAGTFRDSPATTSATTYKIQLNSDNNTGTVSSIPYGSNSLGSIVLMEIGA